ncbi:hypothetical protein B0H12DRAFT_1241993 [Mycena haematopus]|nr:hypothetical protein B0H12DRAFT_1241993 [Mycena haematopus]
MSNGTSSFLTSDRLPPFPIGSWANLVFFTLEVVQALRYFRSNARPRDSVFIKLAVTTNLVADSWGLPHAARRRTYTPQPIGYGNAEAINKPYWPLTVLVFTVGVAMAVSQFFMIRRYWQMTKHHLVFSFLLVIVLGAVTGTFGSGVFLALSLEEQGLLRTIFMSLALVASVLGNVLISPLLFWQLRKRYDTTKWKYIPGTLAETGIFIAAITIVLCVALPFESIRDTMVWIPFAFILGPVYSCTVLYALNGRPESADAYVGNTVEMAHTGAPPNQLARGRRPVGMMVFDKSPVTIMEDSDAFQLTKKKIELRGINYDSDSDSNVSRNLKDELEDMEEPGSRKGSLALSRRASVSDAGGQPSRPYSPSNYSEAPDAEPDRFDRPLSPSNYLGVLTRNPTRPRTDSTRLLTTWRAMNRTLRNRTDPTRLRTIWSAP